MWLIFTLLMSHPSWAEPVDQCTVKGLSNDCEIFKSFKESKITVGNGSFPNPLRAAPGGTDKQATRLAQAQDDMEAFVQKIKRPPLSRRFRRALLNPDVLQGISDEESVKIPWPPGDNKASVREIKSEEFQKGFLDKLSKRDSETFDKLSEQAAGKNPGATGAADVSKKRIAQVNALFVQAQKSLLDSILKGRPISLLSPAEKSAYDKLKSVEFVGIGDSRFEDYFDCDAGESNASYDSETNVLTICPATYTSPDSNIIAYLGHEIGHSIDPCGSQYTLYKLDHDKLSKFAKKIPLSDTGSKWMCDKLKEVATGDYVSTEFGRRLGATANLGTLEKAGVLVRQIDGVPPKDYFLNQTVSCLVNTGGVRDDDSDPSQWPKQEKYYLEDNNIKGSPLSIQYQSNFPHCDATGSQGSSQVAEAVAEIFSARALADYFKLHPPKTPAERIAPFADFYEGLCSPEESRETEILSQNPDFDPEDFQAGSYDALVARLSAAHEMAKDEHPSDSTRLNAIFMKLPAIRAALGCPPTSAGGCDIPMIQEASTQNDKSNPNPKATK